MHLRIILDSRLAFENHLKMVTTKMNKTIGLLSKLQTILITIHTIFVRHHLGHGDTLHVTRNAGGIPHIKVKSISFKNTFFPYAVIE